MEKETMKYEVVTRKETIVEGLEVRTCNLWETVGQDIGMLWNDFYTKGEYSKIENKVNNKTIGLYTDYEGDYTKPYNFIACTEVSKVPEDREQEKNKVIKIIPKGKYAKFVVIGEMSKVVREAWTQIWQMDLKRKYTCDFEEYQNNTQDMENAEIHIYIAIED